MIASEEFLRFYDNVIVPLYNVDFTCLPLHEKFYSFLEEEHELNELKEKWFDRIRKMYCIEEQGNSPPTLEDFSALITRIYTDFSQAL